MAWVVLKFGGTSVSTAARWRCICEQIQTHLQSADAPSVWVTISALTQVTNKLTQAIADASHARTSHIDIVTKLIVQHFALAYEVGLFPDIPGVSSATDAYDAWQQRWLRSVLSDEAFSPTATIDASIPAQLHPLLREFKHLVRILEGIKLTEEASPRIQARVLAFGELLSTHLGVCILAHYGVSDVERVDARELLVSDAASAKSDEDRYLQAEVLPRTDVAAAAAASNGKRVVLTQGFIASTTDGATCVLGRGGSDTSGSLFAALLRASRYEIWTDVHGMFTSDPRYVPDARLIKTLDYREAQELAAMGAKVLHPRCIVPAQWANVPVEIRNTNDPRGAKTTIQASDESESASPKILAVVRRQNMTTLSITAFDMCGTSGFLSKVFAPFEQFGISVDLIATSQFSVTVTLDHIPGGVDGAPFKQLLDALDAHSKVQVFAECSVVSIVGRRLRKSLAELGRVFEVLEGSDVLLLSESAEDLNLSFVLEQQHADAIVARMHEFFFSDTRDSDSTSVSDITSRALGAGLPIRRSSSRDSLLGPTWQSLLRKAT